MSRSPGNPRIPASGSFNSAGIGLLAGADVVLGDDILDRIDEIVPPGADVAPLEGSAYLPPSIAQAYLRRRPTTERAAA